MVKIGIYGAGAIGTALGAYLTRAGEDLVLINRNRAHIEALRAKGAEIVGSDSFTVPVRACTPEEMGEGYDILFLVTRPLDNRETARFLEGKLSSSGIVCTLQNGLPEPDLAEVLGPQRVFGAVIVFGAEMVKPGIVRMTSDQKEMSILLGGLSKGQDTTLALLEKILSKVCPVRIEPDLLMARWSKLILNASFSGLSVILDRSFGEIANRKDTRRIVLLVLKECAAVAEASGVCLAPIQGKNIKWIAGWKGSFGKAIAGFLLPFAMRHYKDIRSGMLRDIRNGKASGIESINGAVSAAGAKVGVKTPFCDFIVSIVREIEAGTLLPSINHLARFEVLLW